jgi:hypothetical protein
MRYWSDDAGGRLIGGSWTRADGGGDEGSSEAVIPTIVQMDCQDAQWWMSTYAGTKGPVL